MDEKKNKTPIEKSIQADSVCGDVFHSVINVALYFGVLLAQTSESSLKDERELKMRTF